jgi:uncharacterized iron-regulated protein
MIHPTDPTLMFEQWAEIQETSVKNSLKSMEMFQKRAEKMADQFWDQTRWAGEKFSDVLMDWGNAYKTGYENLHKVLVPACAAPPKSEAPDTDPAGE